MSFVVGNIYYSWIVNRYICIFVIKKYLVWLQKCKSLYFSFYLHFPSVYGILFFLVHVTKGFIYPIHFHFPTKHVTSRQQIKFTKSDHLGLLIVTVDWIRMTMKHAATFYMFPRTDALIDSVPITVTKPYYIRWK